MMPENRPHLLLTHFDTHVIVIDLEKRRPVAWGPTSMIDTKIANLTMEAIGILKDYRLKFDHQIKASWVIEFDKSTPRFKKHDTLPKVEAEGEVSDYLRDGKICHVWNFRRFAEFTNVLLNAQGVKAE